MEDQEFTNTDLEHNLARQLLWIQAADTRAGFILPLVTSMLGVIAVLLPKETAILETHTICFMVIAVLFLTISLIFIGFSSFPRTTGTEGSLIFFGGISSLKLNDYHEKINNLTNEKYRYDLIAQSHRNAQIATCKYYWVKNSMICIFISLIPWIIAISLLFNHR